MSFFTADGSPGFARSLSRILLALLIPALILGWLFYSASLSEQAFRERNLRWLGQMANQLQDRIRNYDRIVERNAARDPKERDKNYKIVENLDAAPCGEDWKALEVVEIGQEPKIRFRQQGTADPQECAVSDLSKLVELSIRRGVFDSVVLAKREGTVLFQSDPRKIRLTNVDFLFAKPPTEGGALRIPGLTATSNGTAVLMPEPAPGANAPTTTAHLSRPVGDSVLDVSVQPMKLGGAGGDWMLLGISKKGTGWQSSAPKGLILVLPLLLLLFAVSWPLPRLWYMEITHPLRRRDVVLIAICTLALCLIFTVLGLYFSIRNVTSARTDMRLKLLADNISENFTGEVIQAAQQLDILDELLYETPSSEKLRSEILKVLCPEGFVSLFEYADWISPAGAKEVRWTPASALARGVKVADRAYFKDALAGRLIQVSSPESAANNTGASRPAGSLPIGITLEQVLSRTTGTLATMIAIPSRLAKPSLESPNPLPVASIAITPVSLMKAVLPGDFGFAIVKESGEVLFHSDPSRILVEDFFAECQDAPELPGIVHRRVTALIETTYSGVPHRMRVSPIKGLEAVPWSLIVFRSMEPVRWIRKQAMIGASILFIAYTLLLALLLAISFLIVGRLRRRFAPRSVFDLAWWARRSPNYLPVAIMGLLLFVIFWRALDRESGQRLFYASLAGTLLFLILSATGLRAQAVRWSRPAMSPWSFCCYLSLAGFAAFVSDWLTAVLAPVVFAFCMATIRIQSVSAGMIRATWFAWTAQLVLIGIVGPAFALGKIAYDYEAGLYAREIQFDLFRTESQRRTALLQSIRSLPGVADCQALEQRMLASLGMSPGSSEGPTHEIFFYGGAGFATWLWPELPSGSGPDHSAVASTCSGQTAAWCPAATAAVSPLKRSSDPSSPKSKAEMCSSVEGSSSSPSLITGLLASSEVSLEGRERGVAMRRSQMKPEDGRLWSWLTCGGENKHLWLQMDGEGGAPGKPIARSSLPVFVVWDLFSISAWTNEANRTDLFIAIEFWLGLAGAVAVLLAWSAIFRNRVLLLDHPPASPPREYDPAKDSALPRFLFTTPAGQALPALPARFDSFQVIDFLTADVKAPLPDGGIRFQHLEAGFGDEQARLARLDLIESALRDPRRDIVLCTALEPVHYLRTGGAGTLGQPGSPGELARWGRALSYFAHRSLRRVVLAPMADLSAIWDSCSEQEKAVLIHLCDHKLVNPMAKPLVDALMLRGVIRRKTNLRFDFAHPAFERFVSDAESLPESQALVAASKPKGLSPWAIALIMLGVLLFFSQEEITSRLIGFLTTAAGGFEALRRQLSAFNSSGGDKGGSTKA